FLSPHPQPLSRQRAPKLLCGGASERGAIRPNLLRLPHSSDNRTPPLQGRLGGVEERLKCIS
ncbi:MAG: hypothetical protein ACP5E3_13510, partial [Bacteroidales bacterium]